jgi:hypothetical protein
MRKILVGAAAIVAFAAAVFFVPKVSAESGVGQLSMNGTISIPVKRKVTNVFGKTNAEFVYRLTEKEGNPAQVGGLQTKTTMRFNLQPNENNEVEGECKINLQYLRFYKVGSYVLTLSEESTADADNFAIDTEDKYDIMFEVTNVLDSNQMPTGELAVSLVPQLYSYKANAKVPLVAQFEAPAIRTYISLTNQVKGAGADADKYFKYAVTMTGVGEGSNIAISGQSGKIKYNDESVSPSSHYITTGGEDTFYVYLKHGQTATIGLTSIDGEDVMQLPATLEYKIEKVDSEDGYAVTMDGESVLESSKTAHEAGSSDFASTNTTTIVNSKDGTVNTGVFVAAWPYLIVSLFGLSGFVIARRLTRNA